MQQGTHARDARGRAIVLLGSWDGRHFGGRFPLPFGRGEGQGEGLGGDAELGMGQWPHGFSPSPRPSPPPRGRGRSAPHRRRFVCCSVAYPRDLSVIRLPPIRLPLFREINLRVVPSRNDGFTEVCVYCNPITALWSPACWPVDSVLSRSERANQDGFCSCNFAATGYGRLH